MAVVHIFTVDLTGARRQQVLQGPKTVLDPMAPLPRPYEPRPAHGGCETHHIELLIPGLINNDEGHRTIRRTGGPQPRIAHPRDLLALSPRPLAVLLQVVALDLPPIGQLEAIGTLPFHEERALVDRSHVAHELRITKPTICDDHRRW